MKNMKNFFEKNLGRSWKTTVVSYALAILLAVQPLVDEKVNLNTRYERYKYVLRLLFAAGIACLGKYAADSTEEKRAP
jgi:hypothetical protein